MKMRQAHHPWVEENPFQLSRLLPAQKKQRAGEWASGSTR
jgi:hypothetical protein